MNKVLKILALAGLCPGLAWADERTYALKIDAVNVYAWGISVAPMSRLELERTLHQYVSVFGSLGGFAGASVEVVNWSTYSGFNLELGLRYWPVSEKVFEGPSLGLSARKYLNAGVTQYQTGASTYVNNVELYQNFEGFAELAWQKVFDGRWIANLTLQENIYADYPIIHRRYSPIAIPELYLKAGVLW